MHTRLAASTAKITIRHQDHGAWAWLRTQAPCNWQGRVDVEFIAVPFQRLQPAGSCTDPALVAEWLSRMRSGRGIPPLIVCTTERGDFYVHDGNHRYAAMQEFFRGREPAPVRVALLVPKPQFRFRYRFFARYGTYVLERVEHRTRGAADAMPAWTPAAFSGRTLVLVAHPDDETGCAGLLQRLRAPVVVFATDGAPVDPFFWSRYGSQQNYAAVRRYEARMALERVRAAKCEFLNDGVGSQRRFTDQQLYRALTPAFAAVSRLIRRHEPDAVIVPAYEGGHPDYYACSFLGSLVRRRMGLPVWEMPLYHRSEDGLLICQRFRQEVGTEQMLVLTPGEVQHRAAVLASYRSQNDLAEYVAAGAECYRPQPDYDYTSPPHAGTVNYQAWEWPISPAEVCACFSECRTRLAARSGSELPASSQRLPLQLGTACGVV